MSSNDETQAKQPLKSQSNNESFQKKTYESTNIIFKYPKTFIFFSFVILLIIVLSIVLPITLRIKNKVVMVSPKCPDGVNTPKIDCLEKQNENNQKDVCISKGCCWIPDTDPFTPDCVFPYNLGYKNSRWKEDSYSKYWMDLTKIDSASSYSQMKISNLEAKIEKQTDTRLHIKIYPKRNFKNKNQRWEIPSGISNENIDKPLYRVLIGENPFTLRVVRNETNQIIFDTSKSSLIFADQFLQLTTILSSSNLFGIGEHSKESLLQDLNYKTWSIHAAHNHPYNYMENANLYSQYPMYLNIEPDGNSHMVVFYNSNPSEIFLTPFPSLTYRSIGGIFDIYIFMGPTPIDAIAQYQQAFGLPRLPPYWSLGLQIGADGYSNLNNMRDFVKSFKNSGLPFDSVYIGTEYMMNSGMFTISNEFKGISSFVEELRLENRTSIIKFTPGILNNSLNYPFMDGTQNTKIWIMENFFTAPYVGKLLGRDVVYPDFTMERTREWWKDALYKYIVKDENVRLDGIFLDYMEPYNENNPITCQNNKWNLPFYKPKAIKEFLFNNTLCMDARHENSKHYNVHGAYSHYMISATLKALDSISNNRSLIMSRNSFIGSGKMSAKYLGEYKSDWNNFKRFVVSLIEMPMFGFNMVGGDTCGGIVDDLDYNLCSNWIKLSGLSPMMRLYFKNYTDNLYKKFFTRDYFEVLNATLHLRYSLLPYFYTQMYHSATSGVIPIRPLPFQYPNDTTTYKISNQFTWGDKIMVTAGTESQGYSQRVYLPEGIWYDYYRGEKKSTMGEFIEVQIGINTTALHVKGGSVITIQEPYSNAMASRNTFVDIIIALDANFTAFGDFFVDDASKRTSLKRENYHRLTEFKVYRSGDYGIIEIQRVKGRFRTELAYRNLIIYGLLAQPRRISVNEDSNAIDPYRTSWDNFLNVYKVNLQTEQKKKVLVDNEYLSLKWTGGFIYTPSIQL